MDFPSSTAPVGRETWAPRSPVRGDGPTPDRYPERPPVAPQDVEMRDRDRDFDRPGPGPDRDFRRDDRDSDGPPPRRDDRYGGPPPERRPAPPPMRPPTAPNVDANPVLGVFGLSIRTRERDLEDEFSRFGDVEKVVVVYDQRTERSRGFGFITMRNTEDAARCIEKLNGVMLHGRNIRVDYSATQKPHAPTPGEYRGEKRFDDRFPPRRPFDRDDRYRGGDRYGDRYDDRRGGGGWDRDRPAFPPRDRDGPYGGPPPRRDVDDPYGGRSRRDEERGGGDRFDRRRSPSPPRRPRFSASPERRAPPPPPPGGDAPRPY